MTKRRSARRRIRTWTDLAATLSRYSSADQLDSPEPGITIEYDEFAVPRIYAQGTRAWSRRLEAAVPAGCYRVQARVVDVSGNIAVARSRTITVRS